MQFAWRPRKNLLSKEEKKAVVKNLKRYERQFDKADKERTRQLYLEETSEKRADRNTYRSILAKLEGVYKADRDRRIGFNSGYDSDDDNNYEIKTVTVETITKEKTETIQQ